MTGRGRGIVPSGSGVGEGVAAGDGTGVGIGGMTGRGEAEGAGVGELPGVGVGCGDWAQTSENGSRKIAAGMARRREVRMGWSI